MTNSEKEFQDLVTADYDRIALEGLVLPTARFYDCDILRALPNYAHSVLDIGCGDGSFTRKLAEDATHAIGVDASLRMVQQAEGQLTIEKNEGSTVHVDFIQGIAEDLPSDVSVLKKYDAIVANRVLHHSLDLYSVVRKLSLLLAPGGRLILLDLNATGDDYSKFGKAGIIYRLYQVTVLFKACLFLLRIPVKLERRHRCVRFREALQFLKEERRLYESAPWKDHLKHEPSRYHWTQLRDAMRACGMSIIIKRRRNCRFMLLVGQLPDNPDMRFRGRGFLNKLRRFVAPCLLVGLCFALGWIMRNDDYSKRPMFPELTSLVAPLATAWGFLWNTLTGMWNRLSTSWQSFLIGAFFGSWLYSYFIHWKWRRGPVEDRPGLKERFVSWLKTLLRLDDAPFALDFWSFYRGQTNCRALSEMPECQEFLKKHFADTEGQIWIYRSDLRGLIDENSFADLYEKVVDTEYHIDEVRIILHASLLKDLKDKDEMKILRNNLSKMYRRSIILFREYETIDFGELSDEGITTNMINDFIAYAGEETFIFYTQGNELPRRQAVCVNRLVTKPGEDHADSLRIMVAGMRNWPKRRRGRGESVDLEPLEKYMRVGMQQIFQVLFTRGNWVSLYSRVCKDLDAGEEVASSTE
ncbi:class I SAM-dependent methyltransferase [Candidatus Sumerlaeota bacterium]